MRNVKDMNHSVFYISLVFSNARRIFSITVSHDLTSVLNLLITSDDFKTSVDKLFLIL